MITNEQDRLHLSSLAEAARGSQWKESAPIAGQVGSFVVSMIAVLRLLSDGPHVSPEVDSWAQMVADSVKPGIRSEQDHAIQQALLSDTATSETHLNHLRSIAFTFFALEGNRQGDEGDPSGPASGEGC